MLIFLPRWKYTANATLFIVFLYSFEYLLLLVTYFIETENRSTIDFSSLDGVVALFSNPRAVFAGWTHYIAFDFFVSRFIIFDAAQKNISHLLVVPIIPITLLAGPVGFVFYQVLQVSHEALKGVTLRKAILCMAYLVNAALCAMMASWVFVYPASFRLAPGNAHLAAIERLTPTEFVPTSLLTKYQDHPAVQLSHILPAGVWSLCIPLQMHPSVRKHYSRFHRLLGWLTVLSALFIGGGVFLMVHRGLPFERFDFPQEAAQLLALPPSLVTADPMLAAAALLLPWMEPCFQCLTCWYILTLGWAVRCATRRDFRAHQTW